MYKTLNNLLCFKPCVFTSGIIIGTTSIEIGIILYTSKAGQVSHYFQLIKVELLKHKTLIKTNIYLEYKYIF